MALSLLLIRRWLALYPIHLAYHQTNPNSMRCSSNVGQFWELRWSQLSSVTYLRSWHRPRILQAWNRQSGPGIKPRTYLKDCAVRSGVWSLDLQKNHAVRSGNGTLDLQNIVCTKNTKTHAEPTSNFHMECVWWMTDGNQTNRWWPDQLKSHVWTDHSKMMNQSRKICSLQKISFIGNTSCTKLV